MVAVASLIAKVRFAPWLAYCGRHSLPIYLSFALPMAATRIVLLWTGVVSDPGWLATIVTTAAIVAALAVEALVRHTPASFLFTRPSWARQPPLNKEPASLSAFQPFISENFSSKSDARNPSASEKSSLR